MPAKHVEVCTTASAAWVVRRHLTTVGLHLFGTVCRKVKGAECMYGCCGTFERFLETTSLKTKSGLLQGWKATKHKEVL